MVMGAVARAAPELVGKVIATSAALHDKQPRQLGFTLKRVAANEVANRPGLYRAWHDQTSLYGRSDGLLLFLGLKRINYEREYVNGFAPRCQG